MKEMADIGVSPIMLPSFPFWKDTGADLRRYGDEVIALVR